jgi:hypothetical protein
MVYGRMLAVEEKTRKGDPGRLSLGNALLLLPNLVQRRHRLFPSSPPNTGHNTLCRYSETNRGLTHAAAKLPWVGKNFEPVRTRGVESASPLAEYLSTCRSYAPTH